MTQTHRIAAKIASDQHIEPAKAEAFVDAVFDAITQAILSGDQIMLPGIGSLRKVNIAERQDHHPWMGDPITVPASTHLVFEPFVHQNDNV